MKCQNERDTDLAKKEIVRLVTDVNKLNGLLNESKREFLDQKSKYDAIVLQHAELTRKYDHQFNAYQELQKKTSQLLEDQKANDSVVEYVFFYFFQRWFIKLIVRATIQLAKKAEKEKKKLHDAAENTGKIYETYFSEFEADAHSLRNKLKETKARINRNKKAYEKLLLQERSKNLQRLRTKDEELCYLRSLIGNRDACLAKAHGRFEAANELLGMTLDSEK